MARAICLRLLTVRPRTRAELADALAKRGVPDEAAGDGPRPLDEVGLIDDARVRRGLGDSRHHGRGLARRALAAELRRRGVDGEIVGEAVAIVDADDRGARPPASSSTGGWPAPAGSTEPVRARAARRHARPQGLPGGRRPAGRPGGARGARAPTR